MLNKKQKEAVKTNKDAVVIAGAGSGKTFVIQERIKELLKINKPQEILAITFTNKAANELRERVNNDNVNTFTFHGWALKRIKDLIEIQTVLPIKTGFDIINEDEKDGVLRFLIKRIGIENDYKVSDVENFISNVKSKNKDKKIYLDKDSNLRKVYYDYQEFLSQNNQVDYDDILVYYLQLLETGLEIPDLNQVLVDEAQDMNEVQKAIVSHFKKQGKYLFLVGDYDQSIYGWRGANSKVIQELSERFSLEIIKLQETYRFHKKILDFSEGVIKENMERYEKETVTNVKVNGSVYKDVYEDDYDEAENIAKTILKQEGPREEIAILLRNKQAMKPIVRKLEEFGIPHIVKDQKENIFKSESGKVFLSLLKMKKGNYNNSDIVFLLEKLNVVGKDSADKLLGFTFEGIEPKETYSSLKKFKGHKIEDLDGASETKISVFHFILEKNRDTKIKDFIKKVLKHYSYELKYEKELFEILDEESPYEYFIEKRESLDETFEKEEGKVNVLTIHSSKGLEFDNVFVPAVEKSVFPRKQNDDLEEERRVLYVAITRPRKNLWVSYSEKRYIYGELIKTGKSDLLN